MLGPMSSVEIIKGFVKSDFVKLITDVNFAFFVSFSFDELN